MTAQELLEYFGRSLQAQPTLTRLQVRQMIAAVAEQIHEEDPELFDGRFRNGELSEATLRSLVRLFEELESEEKSAAELEASLREGSRTGQLSPRANHVLRVYEAYVRRLDAASTLGPRGFALRAAHAARTGAPPHGIRRFVFVGFDGYSPNAPELRLLFALAENSQVEEIHLGVVLPDESQRGIWSKHGNDRISLDVSSRGALCVSVHEDDAGSNNIRAFARDPFAYREAPIPLDGSISLVRLPDTSLEIEWVVRRVKDQLLSGAFVSGDIAIVDRQMGDRAEEFERLFRSAGVPTVTSFERPAGTIPVIRSIMAVFRLLADQWRMEDLVSIAESPYLPFKMNPALLARVGRAGFEPQSRDEWQQRLDSLRDPNTLERFGTLIPPDIRRVAQEQGEQFTALCEALDDLFGAHPVLPSRWVDGLVRLVTEWDLEKAIFDRTDETDPHSRALLARYDLDALNSLTQGAHDWLYGWELAGRAADQHLTPNRWYSELEAIAREARVRTSTYPREAVQLLTPQQAAMRRWRCLYLTGLVDGEFPARLRPEEATLTQEERIALSLISAEDRAARERLYFHLAVASGTEQLMLTSSSANQRGQAQVASSFFEGARLRFDGLRVEEIRASDLVPNDESRPHFPEDVPAIGAAAYVKWVRNNDYAMSPAARAWKSSANSGHVIRAWQAERARAAAISGNEIEAPWASFAGVLPGKERVVLTPSEIVAYQKCHFRYLASSVWHLEPDTDVDEAAAFGQLHHRILERLYDELRVAKQFPPASKQVIEQAINRVKTIADEEVRRVSSTTTEPLYALDIAFIVDTLEGFVLRDLESALATSSDSGAPFPRTKLEALELRLGTRNDPLWVERENTRFGLFGRVDRLEVVHDDRLPSGVQGALLLKDYKTAPLEYFARPMRYLRGVKKDDLQLPLYAHLARTLREQLVFGFGEVRIAQNSDPEPVWQLSIEPSPPNEIQVGAFSFTYRRETYASENPVNEACEAALHTAGQVASGVTHGRFETQGDRDCWGCRLGAICRAAKHSWNMSHERLRPRMPVTIAPNELPPPSARH